MKIAFIPGAFNIVDMDATHITLRGLGSNLVKFGDDVYVVTVKEKGDKDYENIDGMKVYRIHDIPENPESNYNILDKTRWFVQNITRYADGFRSFVRKTKQQFDIIIGISASPILSLRTILAKKYSNNSKIVQIIKAKSKFGLGNVFSFLLNFVDRTIVPTHYLKNRLVRWGCSPKKIIVIRSSVDTNKFLPRNKEAMKKKYGFKGTVVMYYGHLSELKGIDCLINAIKILRDADMQFLFVTSSVKKFYEPYVEKIKKSGLDKKIKVITGKVKIEDYVNLADIVVLPYPSLISTEGNPSCLLESMASKTPVVTTELPELKEIVKDKEDVLMAKPKNARSLAQNIFLLANSTKLQKKLAENSYIKSKEFDIVNIAKQHQKLYKSLVGRKTR